MESHFPVIAERLQGRISLYHHICSSGCISGMNACTKKIGPIKMLNFLPLKPMQLYFYIYVLYGKNSIKYNIFYSFTK